MAVVDLRRLAACRRDFAQYLSVCEILEKRYSGASFSLNEEEVSQHQIDKVSLQIIPDSFKEPFLPARSTGDGNCLFNSASIALCRDERLAVELRLRTSIELAVHRDFYRNHPVLRGAKIQFQSRKDGVRDLPIESLFDLTCFNSESEGVLSKDGFEAAFKNEVMATSVNYTYSGTLQIMGLASVVGFPLETLYPEQTNKLLPVYQNTFLPRSGTKSSQVLRIMWTNTGGWADRSKEFKVNHFVPLLQKGHDKNADGDWKFVPYKRKGTNIKWNSAKCFKKEGKNVRLSDINNKGESSVQAERKYSAASQDGTKLSMPNDENSKKLDRGTKTNETGSKYTAKQQIDTQGTKKVNHEKVKKRRKAWGEQATGKPKGSSNVPQFVDIKDETAVKSVGQQEGTKVTFPTAEISKEIGSGIETMQSESKSSAKQPLDVKITKQVNLERGPLKDEYSEKAEELELENRGEQKQKHKQGKGKPDENLRVPRVDLKDREENESERIGTVEQQTAEKQATISVEKNPKQTPLVDIANENVEIANRDEQNMDIDNENQTVQQAGDLKQSNDKAYVLFQQYIKERSSLPFPCASKRFYFKQNLKATKNSTRTARRAELPTLQGENKEVIALQRSKVDGTLQENVESIENELNICKDETKRAELVGAMEVAKEIKKHILLSTVDAAKTYKETKASLLNKEVSDYFCAIDTYEKLAKHLNIDQIYIDRKAFLVESKGASIGEVVSRVQTVLEKLQLTDNVTDNVSSTLTGKFNYILQYLDTKKDRDVLEAIVAKITSIKTVVSLKGNQSFKGSIRGHVSELNSNLDKFKKMRSDLETKAAETERTTSQQRADVQRAAAKLKTEMFKSIADGRGRKLKCEEFPELARYIEFAFGEGDRVLRGGGGLEADRRLLDTTLFKAADNATVMRHAKELINQVRPDFKISTSCLYTYTMNYRKGSKQAERHHHGKGVNANISLHKAPNTSQNIYPVNAHWSTSHVNYLIDSASENECGCFLDSKDAKCIVCGDIAPVLKPGKSWANFETPDHSFDQSRVNAVTPMTHLFMEI